MVFTNFFLLVYVDEQFMVQINRNIIQIKTTNSKPDNFFSAAVLGLPPSRHQVSSHNSTCLSHLTPTNLLTCFPSSNLSFHVWWTYLFLFLHLNMFLTIFLYLLICKFLHSLYLLRKQVELPV